MGQSIDFQKLLTLRKLTRAISEHFSENLRRHLRVLNPLFDPRRTFGTYVRKDTKLTPPDAAKQFDKLKQVYESLRGQGKCERLERLSTPMDILLSSVEINTTKYTYQAKHGDERKNVTVISPLKWMMSFKGLDINQLENLVSGKSITPSNNLQKYVLHHLVMHFILLKDPGVSSILEALRYTVKTVHNDEFEKLPMIHINCPISTVRPSDELIIQSTEMSGASIFEEVINIEDISRIQDPFRNQLFDIVKKQDEDLFLEISSQWNETQ